VIRLLKPTLECDDIHQNQLKFAKHVTESIDTHIYEKLLLSILPVYREQWPNAASPSKISVFSLKYNPDIYLVRLSIETSGDEFFIGAYSRRYAFVRKEIFEVVAKTPIVHYGR
jgi:hypothetical protein